MCCMLMLRLDPLVWPAVHCGEGDKEIVACWQVNPTGLLRIRLEEQKRERGKR